MTLELDEATHTYRVDGVVVPSVSEILKVTRLAHDFTGADPFYRDRGIATHKAIALWMRGQLDEESLDEHVRPYFEGFKKWATETGTGPLVLASEVSFYSQRLKYAGTIDLIADHTIYDFKCSKSPDRVAEIQGALYQQLVFENTQQILPFRVIRLPWTSEKDTISYDTKDPNLADATVSIFNWITRR